MVSLKDIEMPEEFQVQKEVKQEERELPNDYPVHYGYFYVCDGRVIQNLFFIKGTISDLKNEGAKIIMNCDIVGRGLMNQIS